MKYHKNIRVLSGIAPAMAALALGAGPAAGQEDFGAWLSGFEADAERRGYDSALVASLFPEIPEQDETSVRLSQSQPEFVRPVWEYLDSAVSERRVSDGRAAMAANAELLAAIEQRYGVDRHALAAIWGLETAYGAVLGDHDVPTALATLGWSGWRPDFVRGELYAVLDILRDGEARRGQLVGSWAGAMGQTQFMPSSYRRVAQDWDGDGLKDLWSNTGDALASAAAYLADAGWTRGAPIAVEVHLPSGFDWSQAEEERTLREWLMSGVQRADGAAWAEGDPAREARLLAPAGAAGPAFLRFDNFRVVMRYNNSTSYALAVSMLADALAGRPGLTRDWPRTEPRMAITDVEEMQTLLTQLGHDPQGIDGALGPNTRAAIRSFQRESGLTPDGAATAELLGRLREAREAQ